MLLITTILNKLRAKTGTLESISKNHLCLALKLIYSDYNDACLRLRRSSDAAEMDFYFNDNGEIDSDAIASWLGASKGYVVKWYDQSPYYNDAYQTNPNYQPLWNNTTKCIEFDCTRTTHLIVDHSDSLYVQDESFTLATKVALKSQDNAPSTAGTVIAKHTSQYAAYSYGIIFDRYIVPNGMYFKDGGASAAAPTIIMTDYFNSKTILIGRHEHVVGSKFYINNNKVAQNQNPSPVNNNISPMYIGSTGTSYPATFDCHSIMFFNKAISSGEIELINKRL